MKVAITTPTGHVGSAVTDYLLTSSGKITVKLLGRRRERLAGFVRHGAQMAIGSLDDADFLIGATMDVDALFWVTPPGYGSDDVRAFQNRLSRAAASAIQANRILRVVNLSSIGADLDSGVGPICGLHDVEHRLDKVSKNITHLRPGFFFENLLWQLESIKKWGMVSLPISGSVRYPMIAARDIGRVAASRLMRQDWNGHSIQELHGPADMSFDEVADVLSEVLDRKIVYVRCTPEEMRRVMHENAISENATELLLEMYAAVQAGTLRATEVRSPATTTPTTLAEFAREVILPLTTEAVPHR